MDDVIKKIRHDLQQAADEQTKESGQRFFKEEVKLYGVKTATVTKIGKKHFSTVQERDKADIFALCDALWQSGYMEEAFIACNWSYYIHEAYQPEDLPIFESWLEHYVSNWATCDTLCNHTIGTFLEMYPASVPQLKRWATSENRWLRRAAAVSLIIPARKGMFLSDILEIANVLLLDGDDLVQKGYGWMLKAASQAQQDEVFDYVMQHKAIMPRTALRYAIEKMPAERKKEAMSR